MKEVDERRSEPYIGTVKVASSPISSQVANTTRKHNQIPTLIFTTMQR
jgi:hypothetical protein